MTAPRRLQLRRGNATAVSTYTGAAGEVVINTTDWTLRVHDGSTVGGYVVTANTTSINANITQANLGMKGYVDSVASQSIYGNSNVKSYLTSGFDGNILPSANVTYSLGSPTRQWRDLFVSNTTIYLGGVPLSIDASGSLTVAGNVVAGTNLVTYGSNVSASAITLSGPTGQVGNVKVLTPGSGFTMFMFYATTGGSGTGLSLVTQGSTLFDPVQFNTRGTGYRVGDIITVVNDITGPGYSDATVVVTELLGVASPGIYLGNTAYRFGADGNIRLPAGGGILDSTGVSVLGTGGTNYSNSNVASYLTAESYAKTSDITTANLGIKGYVDQANTIQSAQISAANIGMKGYVDSQSFYSNAKVASYLAQGNVTIVNPTLVDNVGSEFQFLNGELHFPGGNGAANYGAYVSGSGSLSVYPTDNSEFMVQTYDTTPGVGSRQWKITAAGNLEIPDDGSIVSDANIRLFATDNIAIATTGGGTWLFGSDGKFTLPDSGAYLQYSSDILFVDAGSDKAVVVGDAGGMTYWTFNSLTGNLVFPDASQQATAYSESAVRTFLAQHTDQTFGANVTIQGNLFVNGNITYISVNNFTTSDNIINLADANPADSLDLGISAHRTVGGILQHTGLVRDASANQWRLFSNVVPQPGTTVDFTNAVYDDIQLGNVTSTGNITANYFIGYTEGLVGSITNLTSLNLTVENISARVAENGVNISAGGNNNLLVLPAEVMIQNVPLSVTSNIIFSDASRQTTAWTGTVDYANVTNAYSNVQVGVYTNLSTYAWNANVTAANVGLKGYVDFANTTMKAYVDGQITAANTNVSSSYSNVQVATYLPTYSGNVANLTLGPSGILTFADGTTQITAGGGSYSNVQVATYLPTYAGTVGASLINTSGNILSTGLSVFGNTRIGIADAVSGQFHTVVGNITQTSSGGAVYINTTGNVLAAAVIAGAVTSTGTVAVNAATGITTNQATFLLANATATTINMGGAATTINLGTTASATGNVFVGGQIGSNAYNLTLRANGRYNVATSINSNGGFNSPPYANQPVIGGSGTGMTANYSATGGYIDSLTIYNSGTGYRNGDVISVPGGIAGNSFVLQNYSANRVGAFTGTALYNFGIDGNLVVPGNITATTFVGGGALLTSLPGYAYSNVNVAAYLNATGYNLYSNVNVASYLSTATINTTGNITAAYLTGNINITGNVVGTSPNVTLQAGSYSSVFDNQGNVRLPSAYVTANVTANYFIGNGALLTGIAASSNYSNVNVATYLPTYSGNVANVRLGVSGVLTFADGTTQTTAGGGSYSNVQVATYLPTYSGNVANIRLGIAGVLTFADGTTMTSAAAGTYSNVQVATYLPTYTGSINASNILVTSANIYYANIQAQFIATNTATGALRVMGGVGVAGTVFAANLNSPGNLTVSLVNAGNINAAGNVLAQNVIGTLATASQTNITAVGTLGNLTVTGNVTSSNFVGLTPNVQLVANTSVTTFDIYGNVTFPGNNIISSMGITMPTRPAFRAYGGSTAPFQMASANVNLKGATLVVDYNQGNYANTVTGQFVAPVAGLYQTTLVARVANNNGLNQMAVLKNGNLSGANVICFWETDTNTGVATHFGTSGVAKMAVGDYLSANIIAGNISFDTNDSWTVTYIG